MHMQVVSIEHSLERPHAALGDAALSPIFHRVSARCPVLHLFGYVHIPLDLTPTTAGASALVASTEPCNASSSVPENELDGDAEIMAAATPHSFAHGSSGGGILRLSRATPLVGRLSGTPAPVQQEDASPSPKRVTYALDADGHRNNAAAAGAVARHCDAPSSSFPPPCSNLCLATSAIGSDGDPLILTGGSLGSSAAWRGGYTQRRACLHVHGVYPSLLLPQYDRNVSADQLAAQLEAVALRVLARQGTFVPTQQLVHNVHIVHRFNVYGYRPHAHAFYEVELIDPDLLPRVVDVLQNSTEVGGRRWQLYDAHYRYHTQFMVRWRVSGIAPFPLPAGRCHVRLPTAPELSENLPVLSASLEGVGRLQAHQHSRGSESDAAKRELKDKDEEEHRQAAASFAQQSQLLFRQRWRPDELGRATTAEVELDVAGADLLDHSSAMEEEEAKGAAAAAQGPRKTVKAGDNLSYTRRIIRHYFSEHGVSDTLRVADTIAMERHQQECAHVAAAESKGQQGRYGHVMQIQRGDPTVRWLRHRMLEYLKERTEANAAVAAALAAPSAVRKTEDGGEVSTAMCLASADAATASALPLPSATHLVESAAKLQDQRAIRQQLLAAYRQPGGATSRASRHGHRCGATDAMTTRAYSDGHVAVPLSLAHVADQESAIAGGEALYVGFSSESLQLSVPQSQSQPQPQQPAAAPENAAGQPIPSSSAYQPFFDELSATAYADVAAAPTQDLFTALAQPSAPSLPSQGAGLTTSVAAAVITTPRRSSVSSKKASEADSRNMRPMLETTRELASNADVTSACAAFDSITAAAPSSAVSSSSSWSSWSSALSSSSTASFSSGRTSPDHGNSCMEGREGVGPSFFCSSAAQPRERAQGEPCLAALDAAALVRETPTQRLTQSSVGRSPRISEGRGDDFAFDALDRIGDEAIRPSVGASQNDGSLPRLRRDTSRATLDELVGAEKDHTPEDGRCCAGIAAAASPTTAPPTRLLTRHGLAEGDCVAFVHVRDVASSLRHGEVLAVARVAVLTTETTELQWLLRLSETHLAAEEQALVRRGSWLRAQLPTAAATAAASTAPSMRDYHSHFAGTACDVQLGEVVLSNVYDSVLTSVLEGDTQAAAPSAPTQQLPAGDLAVSAAHTLDMGEIDLRVCETNPEEGSVSWQPRRHRPSDDAAAEVQVWRVHCFTDVAAYHSFAGPPDGRHRPHAGHPSCSSPPLLRVLCRYAYHVDARVLTSVCPAVFTPDVRKFAVDGRSLPSSQRVSSRGGQQLESGERGADAAAAHRLWRAGASSSRVLFTQPQPLLPLGDPRAHSRAAAASLTSPPAPSSPPVEAPATLAKAPWLEASEDGCEDALLFPSSSASTGSSRGGGRDASKRRDEVAAACAAHAAPLGLTLMPDTTLPQSSCEASAGLPSPSAAVQPPQDAADAAPPPAGKCLWRVSLMRTPPPDFAVGRMRVLRGVQAVRHFAKHAFVSQGQARLRRRGASCTADGNRGAAADAAAVGAIEEADTAPQLRFSKETADADGDGNGEPAIGATVSDGSRVNAARSGDTLAAAGERRATEIVVLSAASSCAHSSSAAPMASLMVSSLTPPRSSSSSVDPVREVTASQRAFLDLLQAGRHLDEGGARMVLLQRRGQLGCMVDGMRRCCAVSASGREGLLLSRGSGGGSSGDWRVCVSAVAWPWTAATGVTSSDGALLPCRYEAVASFPAPSVSIAGASRGGRVAPAAARATPTRRGAKQSLPLSVVSRRKSTSHAPGLSLSATQQPQHHLQCTLRVLYIEVLLHHLLGEAPASASEVLAVGLGQATTATNSTIAVRVFCVAAPLRCSAARAATHPSAAGRPPPLVGLTEAVQVVTMPDEAALLARVRGEILAYDPDILISWDGIKYGLGYLALRYRAVLQRNLASDLSRVLQHHGYQRTNANCGLHSAAAASASGGDAGVDSGAAERAFPSVAEEGPTKSGRGGAEAGELAAARYRSRSLASHAAAPFTVRHGSSGGGGEPLPSQESVQSATAMAARSSVLSSAASSASWTAPLRDLDEGDDGVDGGGTDDVGTKGGACGRRGGALAGQTVEYREGGTMRWAHTGLQRNGQSPLLARPRAAVDLRAAASASALPAPAAAAADHYAKRFGTNMHVVGRICTSLGRDLRKEIKMPSYSLSMVHVQLLGQPLPYFTDSYLSELFLTPQCADALGGGERHTALRYLASRVAAPHRIACKLRWFTRLLEFSRMYGILTKEVITRGSQFRVEATLLHFAHPLRYAMLSPSLSQVHRQPRIECIPLVMQPKSGLYRHDPVVVLDFRSLYPSLIIAYNLCYSTCLGIVQPHSHGRLGVLPRFRQSNAALAELLPDDGTQHDGVVFSPNGAMFVPPSTRVGLLPQMVQAVLDTRFEVQAALKHIAVPSGDITMQQRLQEQQLALKMLANVTYGYTAASYTGRMPCVDLAEAIVSLGRQTLERTIELIHNTPAWRAEVVYGDTDSLFVRLAGRTKADAFRIGQEMADAVTRSSPAPIRLQFEKVLLPCLLLVKKRYAGYMWSSPTQEAPTFLAKGIEVVRRDQCPATAQLTDRLLRLLLDDASATVLRQSYYAAVERLQSGAANPLQCIFRRAVKLGRYKDADDTHLPLAARLAFQQMEKDATQTPCWGERLPYVVVRSTTATNKLTDKVLHPERLLQVHDTHSLDATYYIVRHVNRTLDRMFYLVGISFGRWYQAMPRRRTAHAALLNLPTFMAAQQRQQQQLQGVVPPDARGAVPPLFSFDTVSAPLSPRSRQMRLGQLASLMEGLRHHHSSSGVLSALSGGAASAAATTAATAEEISDDEDPSDEAAQPKEVADLTRPSTQEVIDVDQFATQRSNCPSSSLTDAAPPRRDRFLKPDLAASRSGRRKRWRTVTLESFYPRTLCVVCEEEAVSLNDISRQQAVLMRVGVVGCGAAASSRRCTTVAYPLPSTAPAAPLPLPHRLPPICTRCWSDPLSLHLRVQQQCRSMNRQMNALQGLCARCISGGGDAGDAAADDYRLAVADMEDMDAFCMSSTLTRHRNCPGHAYDGVDGSVPRHVLAAVELSAEGVPRGCVSVDCAVGFQKKWVTTQRTQWQALQAFLNKVL
ncbi:putative DNA polymerase zeta catalytic subunit [Leishmania major strain Friedlin]|uniref:DNA polymerase zeta catalytic subunit n=1 Tax=Leishmania major TaxID=5664 RepID=Q4QB19_LEIMA|nr:putative DNA polymerase zeta catalytic subunit [Leishmania major strain Friedlin]CAG9574384.1 DNA_polymerase_zeta_catalytic_subunit_-_putative [Leishmania major strain Friedlin]CAJ04879.1 putative DNA polymerase zeta catalytic subunit [Leishmania major strain Friedlin]|eukprot:XP_001683479.1 putative DNA polymerase zeta catalytic subunit [Leishmania major strain Friedlin]